MKLSAQHNDTESNATNSSLGRPENKITGKNDIPKKTIYLIFLTMIMAFGVGTVLVSTPANAIAECSKKKYEYNNWKRKSHNPKGKVFYAYANGTGRTLTGIKGCGWSGGQKSVVKARALALKNCNKHSKNNSCKVTVEFRYHK